MIITIDGPAGSGKSTVAREVAKRLGLTYLDTGAMYRAVTLLSLERGVSPEDDDALGGLALEMDLRFEGEGAAEPRVVVDGQDVTTAIREPRVSQKVSLVSAHPRVRHALTLRQRQLAAQGDVVLEGRDTGTVVCPTADLKVYLTASAEERARRRKEQLAGQGLDIPLRTLERELLLRDRSDSERALAPLRKAHGAVAIDTSSMTLDEVVDAVVAAAGAVGPGDVS